MTDPFEPMSLRDGLLLRRAGPADVEGIVDLSIEAHGEQERWGLHHVVEHYGPEAWTVVVDDDRVVSTCMLLAHDLDIGDADGISVTLPAGQIEYVATDPSYRRRGLVRAQFEVHHRIAEARGDLVLFITGIPYFYRHLGYSYGLSYPDLYRVAPDAVEAHDGWEVTAAESADLPVIRQLHERAQRSADLRIARADRSWDGLIERNASYDPVLFVARHEGEVEGWMRLEIYERDDVCFLVQAATRHATAAEVLVRHTLEVGQKHETFILDRPGDPLSAFLESNAFLADDFNAVYTRITDPLAVLDTLRPVLDDRLSRSLLAGESGELVISLYQRSIRLSYERGEVTGLAWAPGVEEPDGKSTIGVPPDAFAPLVLGRFGGSGLAARVDDVTLGRPRALVDALFPRLVADVIGVL